MQKNVNVGLGHKLFFKKARKYCHKINDISVCMHICQSPPDWTLPVHCISKNTLYVTLYQQKYPNKKTMTCVKLTLFALKEWICCFKSITSSRTPWKPDAEHFKFLVLQQKLNELRDGESMSRRESEKKCLQVNYFQPVKILKIEHCISWSVKDHPEVITQGLRRKVTSYSYSVSILITLNHVLNLLSVHFFLYNLSFVMWCQT